MKTEPFLSRFESLLTRSFSSDKVEVYGNSSSLSLAFLLTQAAGREFRDIPQLVVTPTIEEAFQFQEDVSYFDPQRIVTVLPPFDISPYSGFFPSKRNIAKRVRWLYLAKFMSPGHIFVAPIEALMQKTMPPDVLPSRVFKKGDDLPSDFNELLISLGYLPTSFVEDVGSFAVRGGIIDIFSSVHEAPVRLELFGDTIESIRHFDPETQKSGTEVSQFHVAPAREVLYSDEAKQKLLPYLKSLPKPPIADINHSVYTSQYFEGIDFLLPMFYNKVAQPLEFFQNHVNIWWLNRIEVLKAADNFVSKMRAEEKETESVALTFKSIYANTDELHFSKRSRQIFLTSVLIESEGSEVFEQVAYPTSSIKKLFANLHPGQMAADLRKFVDSLRQDNFSLFIATRTQSQSQRIAFLLDKAGLKAKIQGSEDTHWSEWIEEQKHDHQVVHIIPRICSESLKINEEQIVFLREDDFFEKKAARSYKSSQAPMAQVKAMKFGDLKPGDLVVHILHGIGEYEGLALMDIQGVPNEYIQIKYKDGDKLYLPIYKIGQIQRFSAPGQHSIDKLGGTGWKKTTIKVRSQLREVASELLKLYAARTQVHREEYPPADDEFQAFEAFFPYSETEDQIKAIESILEDLSKTKPMDRLVCGDVGFGKTEVAMRAAFKVVQSGKQVAVLVPTTTLAIQHLETFRRRFKKWPVQIAGFSRFTSTGESNKTIKELKEGKVDIIIGTHRLFSREVEYKNLGLLIVDEEQKFGVTHKEKIRKIKTNVDTLTLSATPIPRTLNMSLMGIRDLSLINTPPQDRLPTRTFIVRHNPEVIRKAIESEISRGGQVLFVHNRVQSIHSVEDELKTLIPGLKVRIGHGQLSEKELENTIIDFFNNEFQVLLCTTIIESGMDIPRCNTMIVDRADTFGLSQLYQLRGRVGRGQERAYCYLMIPPNAVIDSDAQERLKILQENTALGSGLRIAQYDMELRGTGDLLGESQSGHINAVGYDLYLELLEDALREIKSGDKAEEKIEPEINLRIPAFIPDAFIPDIRVRLAFYKMLSDAKTSQDVDRIEEDLKDRFGDVPEQAINLLGISLIRQACQKLSVKDVSVGPKNLILTFTEHTKLSTEKIIQLATRKDKKYKLNPNNRFSIRLEKQNWIQVLEEMNYLIGLI